MIGTGTALIGAGLLGAGASIYGANKAASAAQSGQRNLGSELGTIIGQLPALNSANQTNQYANAGLYNSQQLQNLQQGLFGQIDVQQFLADHPEFQAGWDQAVADQSNGGGRPQDWLASAIREAGYVGEVPRVGGGVASTLQQLQDFQDNANIRSSSTQRAANLADMQTLAPQADVLRRQLNPELFGSLDRLDATAGTYTAGDSLARSALQQELEKQAMAELQTGGALTPEQQRIAQQQARGASVAQGLGGQNSALAAEVLNLDSARQARLDRARNFAGAVDSSGFAQRATAEQSRQGINNNNFNQRLSAANLRGGFAFDPASVLGTVDNRLNSTGTLGMVQSQFTGAPDYTGALLSYGNGVYDTNANARAAAGLANANAYSSLGGGLLSAAGSLGGAFLANQSSPATTTLATPAAVQSGLYQPTYNYGFNR